MTGSIPLISFAISCLFFAGSLLALGRAIQEPLALHLKTTAARIGRLRSTFVLMLVPMMLVSGLLIDKWEPGPVAMAGSLLAALGVAALAPSRSERSVVLAVVLTAAGAAALLLAGVVLAARHDNPAFYHHNPVASANFGFVFLALGALVTPPVVRWLGRTTGFDAGLFVLAFLFLVPAVFGMVAAANETELPPVPARDGFALDHPLLFLGAAALVLAQAVESGVPVWAGSYLREVGASTSRAAFWVALFWVGFLAARLLTALLLGTSGTAWLVFILALLAAATLGNLSGVYQQTGSGVGLVIVGLSLGPILPSLVGMALRAFPAHPGAACGVLFALGTVGVQVIPNPVNPSATHHSPRRAMWLSMAFTLILTNLALALALIR